MKNIINYINTNIYDNNEISIENCDEEEKKYLKIINEYLQELDLYSRIKFKINFEKQIKLVKFSKELKNVLQFFEDADNQIKNFNELKNNFNNKYQIIQRESQAIEEFLIAFDKTKIFCDINQKSFVDDMKKEFKDEDNKVDILGKEINNMYLFIYLKKRDLYDEQAYKNTPDLGEEYI